MASENIYPSTRSTKSLRGISIQNLCSDTKHKKTTKTDRSVSVSSIEPQEKGSQESLNLSEISADLDLSTTLTSKYTMAAPIQMTDQQFGDLLDSIRPATAALKTVSPKDLPSFRGTLLEDCEEFLEKFEGCADAYRWTADDRKRHFPPVLKNVAYKWYAANKNLDWNDSRDGFREEFGKNQVGFDLAGESGKMLFSEDPRSYVYHVLSYVQATNPRASDEDKLLRLFDGLPTHLKKYFVRDKPTTIDEFTERLKDIKREQMYDQKTLLQATTGAQSISPMLLNNPFSCTSSNQPNLLDNAALLALSNRLSSTTVLHNPNIFLNGFSGGSLPSANPLVNFGEQTQLQNLVTQYQQQLAALANPVIPSFAQIPQSSAGFSNSSNPKPVRNEQESELSGLRKQVESLANQLRTLQTARPNFVQSSDFRNANRHIDSEGRGKCHSCGKPGHIAYFCRSKPRNFARSRNSSGFFGNHRQPSPLVIQDRYTQPMIVPGQNQPQHLTYGPQPLPVGYQPTNVSPFGLVSPEFPSATVNTIPPYYVPPLLTSNDQKNATKLMAQIPAIIQSNSSVVLHASQVDVVGAVQCSIKINNATAQCVIDSGSGISLVSRNLVANHRIPTVQWQGPHVSVADGKVLDITEACVVEIEILGLKLTGICGIMEIEFDALLGMDFLKNTPFMLDFGSLSLINPDTGVTVQLSFLTRSQNCEPLNVVFPENSAFPFEPSLRREDHRASSGALSVVSADVLEQAGKLITRTENEDTTTPCSFNESSPTTKHFSDYIISDLIEFSSLSEGDEDFEKPEMWLPGTKSNLYAWPITETVDLAVWQNLNVDEDLPKKDKEQLFALLKEFPEVFPTNAGQLGFCSIGEHCIDTGDNLPMKQKLRKFSLWAQEEISKQVKTMLEMDVIRPCSSEWAANCVVVFKKNRTARVCIDYRDLNAVTKKDTYPICDIQSLFDSLCGSTVYTSLELFSGYYQVAVKVEDQEKTAFLVPGGGLYCFKRMPCGLCNAPATVSRIADVIFSDVKFKFVLPYLDDFTTFSKSFDAHLIHLKSVVHRLKVAGLKIKPNKCFFAKKKITFLGHEISGNGIEPSRDKLKAVEKFERPRNLKSVKSFLGLTSYYRKFIPNYAEIADSLIGLTKKDKLFCWEEAQERAFCKLKTALTTYPVLRHFNPAYPVEIHTDASGVGVGAVLIQRFPDSEATIAFASKSLNPAQRNYGVTELELFAVIFGVEKFQPYLSGNVPFKIITDHAAIVPLLKTKNPIGRLAKWLLRLSPFVFQVVYRPGKENVLADALSRYPVSDTEEPIKKIFIAPLLFISKIDIRELQSKDAFCNSILEALHKTSPDQAKFDKSVYYIVKNEVLYRRTFRNNSQQLLLVVPRSLRKAVVSEAHDALTAGHLGVARTLERIRHRYYFPGSISYVHEYVKSCESCQHKKSTASRKIGFLQPLPVAGPFLRVHLDFTGPFPVTARRNQYVIIGICPFTKYVNARAVTAATSVNAARFLLENVILKHGMVRKVLTDRGTHFLGSFMREISALLNVKHLLTSPYHPQTDGQAERCIQTFSTIVSHFLNHNQKNWDVIVPYAEWCMNTMHQETTGFTPFELVHGRAPLNPIDISLEYTGFTEVNTTNEYLRHIKEWLSIAHEITESKLKQSFDEQAPRYNEGRKESSLKEGDLVLEWKPIGEPGLTTKFL